MWALVIKKSENEREIRYNSDKFELLNNENYRIVHLCPVEIQRIREATLDEVQKILRRYI